MSWWTITEGIPETQDTLVTYNLCSDGIYMTKKIAGGKLASIKVDGIPGLPKGEEKTNLLSRRIPFMYLIGAVNFFNYVAEKFGQYIEAYVIIGYSNSEDKYKIWVPEHMIDGSSVDYDISKFSSENPGYHIVMDIHSHHAMPAFFSGTDNRDDIRDRFSGVVGKLDKGYEGLECKFRFSANGKYWDYEIDEIFVDEGVDAADYSFNWDESLKKIKRRGRAPFRAGGKNGSK